MLLRYIGYHKPGQILKNLLWADIEWSTNSLTNLSVVIDANRVATITPLDGNWTGSEEVTFTAEDEGELTDSDAAIFTVNAVNQPPVVTIPDQTIQKGESFAPFDLDTCVTDDNTAIADIVWSISTPANLSVSMDANNVVTITYRRVYHKS